MRILSNDFGGYPYALQLARALAARGHTVMHTYCASLSTTPQAALTRQDDDPPGLQIVPVRLDAPLEKYAFVRRWQQEREYGRKLAALVPAFEPDVVLSGNTPLDAQETLMSAARSARAPFIFWLQDVIGIAADRILRQKIPVLGGLIGRYYVAKEARQLRRSARVVPITDDFKPILAGWGVDPARVTTVENWAPVEELPLLPKDNPWAREAGLGGDFVFLYSGTLALKHNPELLLDLARAAQGRTVDERPVRVVVLSQGPGADYLRQAADDEGLATLDVRPFVPFEDVPATLAAADVLVAVLEPDASVYSVPSKVLAYLCGARPVLLAVPPDNLAARIVTREGAGVVVAPDDTPGFLAAAERLMADAAARDAMGEAARAYAEATFAIDGIADRVERVLEETIATPHRARR